MTYNRAFRISAAAFTGVLLAALTTAVVYVILVAASFFVLMPVAARNGALVSGLLAIVFAVTLILALRKTLPALRSCQDSSS